MHCDLLVYDKIFKMGELWRHSIKIEIYLTFENFLPALTNVLIDTEDYFYFENDLIPVSKKIDVINFSPEDEILVNGKLLKSKGAVTLEKFMNVLEILRENIHSSITKVVCYIL